MTGSNQFIGNWPGVTVEKKSGHLIGHPEVEILDLPGLYSLAANSLEEIIASKELTENPPDAIINIVDGTNLERNLYMTTQLFDLGIPLILVINMADELRQEGISIDADKLSERIGYPVVAISALKGKTSTSSPSNFSHLRSSKTTRPKQITALTLKPSSLRRPRSSNHHSPKASFATGASAHWSPVSNRTLIRLSSLNSSACRKITNLVMMATTLKA